MVTPSPNRSLNRTLHSMLAQIPSWCSGPISFDMRRHANSPSSWAQVNLQLVLNLLVLTCAALSWSFAGAQNADPCANEENTVEINMCLDRVFKARDRELNEAYQSLLKQLSTSNSTDKTDYPGIKKELADAQRAWIIFRDSDCTALYKFWETGTIRGIKYAYCRIEHTEKRTIQLKRWARV